MLGNGSTVKFHKKVFHYALRLSEHHVSTPSNILDHDGLSSEFFGFLTMVMRKYKDALGWYAMPMEMVWDKKR